ncbi:hypothetical protein CRV00_09635 [Malaciobacter molluscorum]|uniref:LutC/YkgG family protein n=1 Tax=Malaciobacter molluscorum TaxID=1032072 RepID=UPI00100A7479|nr:LUD domain-containing protein [Malaciobacter molluscorum]RXJ93715.1 hypothetical protein CRV00_09635 [Malaciobacter molluscorum]
MTSKEQILASIREDRVVIDTNLPSYDNFGMKFENKFEQYKKMLESVGGNTLCIKKEQLDETIMNLYPDAKIITSNVKDFTKATFDANAQDDIHTLKDIELCVVEGNFAVAENGAVWVKNSNNRHRGLYFISENIVIVVKKDEIVNNMHEAYERISFNSEDAYGVFISGPSKTADIEQSLVIGAHGPKSGYVIFVD